MTESEGHDSTQKPRFYIDLPRFLHGFYIKSPDRPQDVGDNFFAPHSPAGRTTPCLQGIVSYTFKKARRGVVRIHLISQAACGFSIIAPATVYCVALDTCARAHAALNCGRNCIGYNNAARLLILWARCSPFRKERIAPRIVCKHATP